MEGRNPKAEIRKTAKTRRPNRSVCGQFFCHHFSALSPRHFGRPKRDFGFRISAFFRPSDFGLRVSSAAQLLGTPLLALAADTNGTSEVPESSLRPPRGEIVPGFWEQNGTWLILGAILLLFGLAALVWLLVRPKSAVPIPPAVEARRELEPLQQNPEDGGLLSRVSQILRRYVAAVFALPPGEFTTAEFTQTLANNPKVGSALGGEVTDFLRACDLRKFAPSPAQSPLGAVSRALSLIERAESRVTELAQLAAAQNTNPGAESHSQPGQGIASGA